MVFRRLPRTRWPADVSPIAHRSSPNLSFRGAQSCRRLPSRSLPKMSSRSALAEANKLLDECAAKIGHCVNQLSDEQILVAARRVAQLDRQSDPAPVRQPPAMDRLGGRRSGRHASAAGRVRRARTDAEVGADRKADAGSSSRPNRRSLAVAPPSLRERTIQGFAVTGWGAIFHSVPHFNGHTQEIVCYTRMQLGDAYKFYWQPQTPEQGAV